MSSPIDIITKHMSSVIHNDDIVSFNWNCLMQGYDVSKINNVLQTKYETFAKYFEPFVIRNVINQCAYMITSSRQKELRIYNIFHGVDQEGDSVDYKLKLMSASLLYESFRLSIKHSYRFFPSLNRVNSINDESGEPKITKSTCIEAIELIDSLYIAERIINDPNVKQVSLINYKNHTQVEFDSNKINKNILDSPVIINFDNSFLFTFKREGGMEILIFKLHEDELCYDKCLFVPMVDGEISLDSDMLKNEIAAPVFLFLMKFNQMNSIEGIKKASMYRFFKSKEDKMKERWMMKDKRSSYYELDIDKMH